MRVRCCWCTKFMGEWEPGEGNIEVQCPHCLSRNHSGWQRIRDSELRKPSISQIAYDLWEKGGCKDGNAHADWSFATFLWNNWYADGKPLKRVSLSGWD